MNLFSGKPDAPAKDQAWGPRGTAAATFAARLSFEHVSHSYEGVDAVVDASLELAPGEIVCLLGPSGCGKTTLLRIAAGIERPKRGRILINGEEIVGPNGFVPPERRNVGLMFQDFALFPHLSILDNVAFGLKNIERSVALSEARAALRRVGMSAYENTYPHVLSGGEQQRVALARAIVPRPAVVLMDEPFSGLDQRLRESVREETLLVLRETRASCLLVTHDPVEAMWMADRIVVMRSGPLVQPGPPAATYRHPVDVETARFFSDFNELYGTAQNGSVETPLGSIPAPVLENGERALIMIRPQALRPVDGSEGVEGMVTDVRFLGDVNILTVAVHECDSPLSVRVPGTILPEKGTVMRYELDREHVLVFPAGNGPEEIADDGYQESQ